MKNNMSKYIGNSMIISNEKETTPFGLKEKERMPFGHKEEETTPFGRVEATPFGRFEAALIVVR
jgi:hypothetical protein